MESQAVKMRDGTMDMIKSLLSIAAITFVVELLVMYFLVYLGVTTRPVRTILLEAGLLSVLAAPAIYWLIFAPAKLEFARKARAGEESARGAPINVIDPISHVSNRRGITIDLIEAMAHAERYGNPLSVALVDLDHLKQINDAHGRAAGDKVLEDVAAMLTEAVRMPDRVGRYGGIEFLLVLPETDLDNTCMIADRIRATVSETEFEVEKGKRINVTICIGATQFRPGDDLEQFLSRADQAVTEAKQGGRNKVVGKKA